MDDARIREAVALLDREIPRDGARVKLDQYGGGPDECRIVATKTGYLRLGVEFLKAAYAHGEHGSPSVAVDIEYLLTSDSEIGFDWFERREPDVEPPMPPSARLVPYGVLGALILLMVLACVDLVVVFRWLLP